MNCAVPSLKSGQVIIT